MVVLRFPAVPVCFGRAGRIRSVLMRQPHAVAAAQVVEQFAEGFAVRVARGSRGLWLRVGALSPERRLPLRAVRAKGEPLLEQKEDDQGNKTDQWFRQNGGRIGAGPIWIGGAGVGRNGALGTHIGRSI